jgi:hypothetical protein
VAQINLSNTGTSGISTPQSGVVAIFSNSADSGKLYYRFSDGSISAVDTGGGGGAGTSGTSGTSGVAGTSGEAGTSGTSGTSGAAGTSGEAGTSGTSGEAGTSGTSGEAGTSGTSGEAGTSGTSGENGTSGTSGENGTSGTSGFGTSGTSGFGTSGTSGENGTSGTSGENGTSGTSGEAGTSGTSGENGTSGTSGENGTSGTSGEAGTSGTSGESGTSGQGVPAGGTTSQVLAKIDGTDYNTEWVDQSGGGGGVSTIVNNTVRYVVASSSDRAQLMSTGTLYTGLTWSRTGTSVSVTSTSHGLTTGDYIVVRGGADNYLYVTITNVTTNAFDYISATSGTANGTDGAYVPAFDVTAVSDSTITVASPSSGDCQLISMAVYISSDETDPKTFTVPLNALSNGAGGNSALNTRIPPSVRAYNVGSGTSSWITTTTVTFNTSANHNVYSISGGLGTFASVIITIQF